jgi:DNA-binding CsgD family transcriptional regulator/tetratricopeptide (TPR) repeat protein
VGRVAELEALEAFLGRSAAGSGGAMLVAGEAGMGKSRLVSELVARAHAEARTCVLVGECVELAEGELAFAPIVSALREVMKDATALEGLEAPLRSALTVLWPVSGATDGVGGREQLFEAVYRVLTALAGEQPVLIVLEDVHWIDPSSCDLLAFLVRNARHDRVAIVATYRPEELHRGHPLRPFLAELERSGRAERIELEALGRSETAQQLEGIAGTALSASTVERVFARSEGNPFYAEELFAQAARGAGELPSSLREVLLLRVERLGASTREVLQAAAVVGRSVDHRLLAEVVGVEESGLLGALREATDHHVLLTSRGGSGYRFRHALLGEAIYDDTLVGERLRLHRAIAEALTAHREYASTRAAAELAHHWHAAGDLGAALAASVQAAREAAGMYAYGEALRHVDRALGLWELVPAAAETAGCDRIELLLRASRLADWAGDPARPLALAEEARALVDEHVEPLRAAAAESRIGRAMHYAGRGADAIEHLVAARRLVPREPPSLEYVDALVGEGRVLMVNGRMRDARERLEEAMPLVELLGARELETALLSTLTAVYSELGEFERAIAVGRDGLRIANEIGSAEDIVRGYVNWSQAIDNAGRIEEALAIGIEGISVADRLGLSRHTGDQLRQQAAWRLQRIGRLGEAERMLQPALESATTPFNIAACHNFAGRIAVERGELDLAARLLERGWALVEGSGGFQLIGPAIAALVLLEIRRGELYRARERARDGVERAVATPGDVMYTAELHWLAVRVEAELAELARASRDQESVGECGQLAEEAFQSLDRLVGQVPGEGPPPEAVAFLALAGAELSRVRAERDPEPWSAAARTFGTIGLDYPAAYADFRAAEALALAGAGHTQIAGPLRTAYAAALEIGARPFLGEVLALARRARVRLGPREDDHELSAAAELGLSDRELEVLRLLADGRTNRQIGEQLFITTKTASAHVSHILMKLGVANRAEAAAAAHRLRLIDTAPAT